MKLSYSFLLLLSVILSPFFVSSQITNDTIKIETPQDSSYINKNVVVLMSDGDEYRGIYIEKTDKHVIIKTNNGEIRLLSTNIKTLEIDTYEGEFKFPNPHDTRYFFGPTAIPIKKGTGYYQNLMLLGNFVNFGITRNLSIGGGFEFISTLIIRQPIYFLTPKVGFELADNFHFGGGVLFVGISGENSTLGYTAATVGTSEKNITLGIGFGVTNGFAHERPTIMLSGQTRVSNGVSLMTENYILPSTDFSYIGIQGVRLLSRNNAFDIGLVIIPELISEGIPLPYIGYARVFGREKKRK